MSTANHSNAITLRGSAKIVTEFFAYGVNSILYQRGIYPCDQFERKQKYGLTLLVTSDPDLKNYINRVLGQLNDWLNTKIVQKVIVVVADAENGDTVERWQFDIECDKSETAANHSNKSEKEINNEIQAIIRQITASVSFLPMINAQCTFEMLIYTDKDADVPEAWTESDAKMIQNGAEVFPMRQFSTDLHTVKAAVAFKHDA
eukprot:m.341308 g.341308  ORF g.341308 m.341308 type:complete len:203 (-) comp19992_c0_seq1:166-774(-)